MRTFVLGFLGLLALVLVLGSTQPDADHAAASSPGTTAKPLLTCPDVDGSGSVRSSDITAVVNQFGNDATLPTYKFMYDLDANGVLRSADIVIVVQAYGPPCPLVDTQVAQATVWAYNNVPMTESEASIEALGYHQASNDVPGQGVHYFNFSLWDGAFSPTAPEGLVYHNGKFAALVYVADAPTVGLGTHAPGPCNPGCPGKIDGVELETAADGPQCNPACSWAGGEKWHLHYYLCTAHIGTSSAIAIPGSFVPSVGSSQANCAAYAGEQECTTPVVVQPCYKWGLTAGWMGHLYNGQPNKNLIPDTGGTNGRFADCFPDAEGWKATNCPG
jgi:hypothetical protein